MGPDLKKEAILNEIKGNLFEYLVSLKLAQEFKVERDFIHSLPKQFNELLRNYDYHIRTYYPELLHKLPLLADRLVSNLTSNLSEVKSISLVGKIAGASHNQSFSEADVLIYHIDGDITPVSVKLCRHGSFMNTKSGGISSFIKKYFFHDTAHKQQDELNQFVDLSFEEMARELHASNDLEYKGTFSDWKNLGLAVLPGELDGKGREILHAYYHRISVKLHSLLVEARKKSPEKFVSSLYSLIGFGRSDLLQAVMTHDKYEVKDVLIHHFKDSDLESVLIKDHKEKISNFEISIGKTLLQIRIKPMNQFITKSFKVNCSIKYL